MTEIVFRVIEAQCHFLYYILGRPAVHISLYYETLQRFSSYGHRVIAAQSACNNLLYPFHKPNVTGVAFRRLLKV